MKKQDLIRLGVPSGLTGIAVQCVAEAARAGLRDKEVLASTVEALVLAPGVYAKHPHFGKLARELMTAKEKAYVERETPAPYKAWGEGFEAEAIKQMENACRLPISVRGALMPDAHVGYGLPIGGVLATRNTVVPYGVGMDIACRMRLSILDLPLDALIKKRDRLIRAIEQETRFGVGAHFEKRREHEVMEDKGWLVNKFIRKLKDLAWSQLGSSGKGNHFAEYGILTLLEDDFNLPAGQYLAFLTHSGSRGCGAKVATEYSEIASGLHEELPKELQHLAWLDLDSGPGQEYWQLMELMGRYAAANHQLIHEHIARNLGVDVILELENHHNFAWKEKHFGEEVIVHRKGATPAGLGDVGIIPGSMGTPGYVVRGKGNPESLNSASHGAGRAMSRKKANQEYSMKDVETYMAERGITLISASAEEIPMAYKDIEQVMDDQSGLVDRVARFDPKIVKMGEDDGPRWKKKKKK